MVKKRLLKDRIFKDNNQQKKEQNKIKELCDYVGLNTSMGNLLISELELSSDTELIESDRKLKQIAKRLGLIA